MMKLKTLEDINLAFNANRIRCVVKTPHSKTLRVASDILFYAAIFIILYTVIAVDRDDNAPASILGYTSFTVMSSSMKDEIPKGSLIIIRKTDPETLKAGDNITYMHSNGALVTHKIIDIINAEGVSSVRFQTKGTNNATKDDYTVAKDDVLGKVIFVLPGAGAFINAICGNIHIIFIIVLLCSFLSFLLRGISTKRKQQKSFSNDSPLFSK